MHLRTTFSIIFICFLMVVIGTKPLAAQVEPAKNAQISAKPPPPPQKKQSDKVALAAEYYRNNDYEKAAILFKELYDSKRSSYYYSYYLQCLINLKHFNEAISFTKSQKKLFPGISKYDIDLGYVYSCSGKTRKAEKIYNSIIDDLPNNRNIIIQTANNFRLRMLNSYAIKTYEKGRKLLENPSEFGINMAYLYELDGNFPMATATYLELLEHDPSTLGAVQARMQGALEKDEDNEKHSELRKQLIRKTQKFPGNTSFPEMIIWLALQEKDFETALVHAKVLDRRYQEEGQRLFEIAGLAAANEDYQTALDALKIIIAKGEGGSMYMYARIRQLVVRYLMYHHSNEQNENNRNKLSGEFKKLIEEFGLNQGTVDLYISYAQLLAYDMQQSDDAALLLNKAIAARNISREKIAACKIELADIYLFTNNIWEATLLYSQVEKDFKNDVIGHDAKFKNAQLSFFIGEFGWAKTQLDVLKAATSKLIANDAMELSLLISDNPDPDSTQMGLRIYAKASLLEYRTQYVEALELLDSIGLLGLSHPLDDDVLLKKSEIYEQLGDYQKADSLLNHLVAFYPDGILADNALIRLAEINDSILMDQEKALEYYKTIITEYPGSVFTTRARKRFRELRGN